MSDRDDMVMRPSLGERRGAAAPAESLQARAARQAARRHSLVQRGVGRAAARRMLGRAGGQAVSRIAARGTVYAMVALIVARLATGRSSENLAANINEAVLGGADEAARARLATRQSLENTPGLLTAIANSEEALVQAREIAKTLQDYHYKVERGKSILDQDKDLQTAGAIETASGEFLDMVSTEFRRDYDEFKQALREAVGFGKGR